MSYHQLAISVEKETTVNKLLRLVRFYGQVHSAKVAFKELVQTIQSESEARINARLDDLELAAAQDITTTPNADAVLGDPRAPQEMRSAYGHARKVSAERGAISQSAKERLDANFRAWTRAENGTAAAARSTFDYVNGIPERSDSPETSFQA
ncbi:hypothetical protein H0H93_001466 [Arthromyces matolae]|nr:hypothetical protein H0H93_001466 [Arthromyces matolae]